MQTPLRQTLITIFLLFFAVLDLGLAVATIVFPDFWFRTFHGVPYAGQDPQRLLWRTGAIWAAFSLFHFVALVNWKRQPYWLVIVGGMRLGEIFADAVLVVSAQNVTALGQIAFWGVVPSNIFFALFFISNGLRDMRGLKYLGIIEFNALRALADVLVCGDNEVIPPDTIAKRVDAYLSEFRAGRKFIAKAALMGIELYPLLSFNPPFSTMSYDKRKRFVTDRFYRDVVRRKVTGQVRGLVQAMIRFGQQLSFLGYYSDPKTFPAVGYVPFSKRVRFPEEAAKAPPPPKLDVTPPSRVTSATIKADVVVIGSGAAGAILAHELVAQKRDVLVLERGRHVPRTQFSEDEVEMISRLYDEGALQLASNFRMQVLQGSCVGGTTVVNNAVCFDLPAEVLGRWNDHTTHDAGIDAAGLDAATQTVRRLLKIQSQDITKSVLNPSDRFFEAGLQKLGLLGDGSRYAPVEANIGRCVGCGYCNIGCAYGTKFDMQETVLPAAQAMEGAGSLRILAECRVTRIRRAASQRVSGVDCELSNGRKVRIEANTVVLAAGAISSPYLLLKSGIARDRAGRGVSFNVGSPITARLPERVNAYDGLQISHYLDLHPDPGFVVETWFNPPVAQAMGMPGWFDDHFNNMRDYAYMAAAAPLVGTGSTGKVSVDFLGNAAIDFDPSPDDLSRIKAGLKQIASIFLAGGAERVMPSTFKYLELRSEGDLSKIDAEIKEPGDVAIGTGHPQGGNAISKQAGKGVVDPEFRVRGFDNLYCCDASIFPTSTGVNPQLTVMSLAKYASQFVRH